MSIDYWNDCRAHADQIDHDKVLDQIDSEPPRHAPFVWKLDQAYKNKRIDKLTYGAVLVILEEEREYFESREAILNRFLEDELL